MGSTSVLVVVFCVLTVSSAFVTVRGGDHLSTDQLETSSDASNININVRSILGPPTEILRLLEGFLQIKGDVASRAYSLIYDNYDFLRSASSVIVNSVPTVHSIALGGVQILRSVLEFVIQVLNEWDVTVPSISFGEDH